MPELWPKLTARVGDLSGLLRQVFVCDDEYRNSTIPVSWDIEKNTPTRYREFFSPAALEKRQK